MHVCGVCLCMCVHMCMHVCVCVCVNLCLSTCVYRQLQTLSEPKHGICICIWILDFVQNVLLKSILDTCIYYRDTLHTDSN